MEDLRSTMTVSITTPILAEDSTRDTLALSLIAVLEQLDRNAKQHDYMVALLLVLLAESGFRVSPHLSESVQLKLDTESTEPADNSIEAASSHLETPDDSSVCKNTRLVYIPQNWKSPTDVYEVSLVLNNCPDVRSKLIAIPDGDKLIVNMFPCIEGKRIYSLILSTLKYVNPYSWNPTGRYMNLREISHRFKNDLATPTRTDILSSLNLMGPSLQSLPTELQLNIIDLLRAEDITSLAMCCRRFSQICSEPQIWKNLGVRDKLPPDIVSQCQSQQDYIRCKKKRKKY